MKRHIFLLLTILLLATQALHGQKRPFTIEDLYRINSVSDIHVSPDGKALVYVLTTSDLARAKRSSHVWMIDIDGKNARPLTQGEKSASSPQFSPDGKWISFISARDGGSNLYLMPATGGESKRLTNISTGVSDPLWSPDGKWIAFSTDVYPECGSDDACNKKIAGTWGDGPLKAHMADELLYRHWTAWKDGTRTHTFVVNVASAETRDVTPGTFDAPTFQLGGPLQYDFSPDATELVYVSNHDKELASSTNNDLWLVSLTDKEAKPRNITASNPAYDGSPEYSPDGKYIAYRTQKQPGYESDLFRLAIYDRASGQSTVLTEPFRNWVEDFEWSKDSKSIFFSSSVEGQNPIYRLDIASRSITRLIADRSISAFDLMPDEKSLIYIRHSVGEPAEIYRDDLSGGKRSGTATRLTRINEAVTSEVDIRPAEQMWVDGAGGAKIHVFIVKPHNFDPTKKYPLILNVHGGPQQMWGDSFRGDWQVYPGAGYVVAFANPHGSTGYGQDFTAQISGDLGGQVYQDLMKVTDALEKLPYVDGTRMGAMGWSYGGYMMMWFEGHTDRFKALASMMGIYDWRSLYGATEELWWPQWDLKGQPWNSENYEKWSASNFVKNFKTPALVISGERDYRVPYTQSLQFYTALQKMNVPSRLIIYSNAGHWPNWYEMALYYTAHLEWFHKYLGGDAPSWTTEQFLRNAVFDRTSGQRTAGGSTVQGGSSEATKPAEQEKKPSQTPPPQNPQGKPDAKPTTP
jgi:dipeptidyl aminopeptidase/acylaminoacyl peptidase